VTTGHGDGAQSGDLLLKTGPATALASGKILLETGVAENGTGGDIEAGGLLRTYTRPTLNR